MTSDPPSPTPSNASTSSSASSISIPEALAHGREKRATAGNKLRALLDAEFQEDELFKEDEHDEEFESEKSEEGEDYLSESSSDEDEEKQDDEEEGERALIAQQKADAKISRERKRKAADHLVKPAPKKRVVPRKENIPTETVLSKAASTTSSISNRRISFDPLLHAARRSSRALTVQTTNEVHSRIISAAARRASQPIIQKRERTPPLTQEERLAQAILTEEENKMSLKRIVEAEEERARKRREKLEALRRRQFNEPVIRFISRRVNLIEETPDEAEDDIIIDDAMKVKEEEVEIPADEDAKESNGQGEVEEVKQPNEQPNEPAGELSVASAARDKSAEADIKTADIVDHPTDETDETGQTKEETSQIENSGPSTENAERMDIETGEETSQAPANEVKDIASEDPNSSNPLKVTASDNETTQNSDSLQEHPNKDQEKAEVDSPPKPEEHAVSNTSTEPIPIEPENPQDATPAVSLTSPPSPKVLKPHTPPPYHEANIAANTISYIPLPGGTLPTTRETFFPDVPLIPPPKPKPSARCPITGLPVRYKDPLSGIGYYDIHAFKILREVGRKGSRYIWCTEGGWFVGETGWGGRPAKGVPEGWSG